MRLRAGRGIHDSRADVGVDRPAPEDAAEINKSSCMLEGIIKLRSNCMTSRERVEGYVTV